MLIIFLKQSWLENESTEFKDSISFVIIGANCKKFKILVI